MAQVGRLEVICGSQAAGGGLYSPGPTSEAPGTAIEGRSAEQSSRVVEARVSKGMQTNIFSMHASAC